MSGHFHQDASSLRSLALDFAFLQRRTDGSYVSLITAKLKDSTNRFLNFIASFAIVFDCQAQSILQGQLAADAVQFRDQGGAWQTIDAMNAVTHGMPYVTPFGAPSLFDLGKTTADIGTLRGWGYIGDGLSHPLSSVASFNGASSVGRTLAQWQAVLSAATALTDEIDGVAIQSVINAGRPVFLPPGMGRISRTITASCSKGLSIRGSGPKLSSLVFTAGGADGIDVCVGQPVDNQQTLTLRDFELYCSASSGNCGTAINANLWVPTGFHEIDNVEIRPLAGHNWANGINAVNASRLEINRASISGTFAPTTSTVLGVGITLATATNPMATKQGAFATNITDTEIYGWGTCIVTHSTTDNGVEGVRVDGGSCDASNNFLAHVNSGAATYQTPDYIVTGSQIHLWKQVMSAKGITSLFFYDNLLYLDTPGPGAGVDYFSLDDIQLASFHNNQIFITTPGPIAFNSIYNFKGTDFAPNNITIDDDFINNGFSTASVTTAGIIIPSPALFIHENGTVWNAWNATGKPKVVNRSANQSNRLASQFMDIPGMSLSLTGELTYVFPFSGTTDASGIINASIPAGYLLDIDGFAAQGGDYGVAANENCGPVKAGLSLTNAPVKCVGAVSTAVSGLITITGH
jgi:hypothetical protein